MKFKKLTEQTTFVLETSEGTFFNQKGETDWFKEESVWDERCEPLKVSEEVRVELEIMLRENY